MAQDVGTNTMLTHEQCCNKTIKGTGTQSAKQQPGYNNNVDTQKNIGTITLSEQNNISKTTRLAQHVGTKKY